LLTGHFIDDHEEITNTYRDNLQEIQKRVVACKRLRRSNNKIKDSLINVALYLSYKRLINIYKKDGDMNREYKTINLTFKNRWTKSELNTDELDDAINAEAKIGWDVVSVSISTLFGYPQSALCVYKKEI